ncbi:Endonuclease/exonuclease/phosphatase [Lophiotrema nucula]|uniref:Endonuclease/exonuclease/phosphatase n=1 Tax=Lophiotrema nucula TaxID=690887 RepID=A0A6A5YRN4_9PLEO|nr:Endonuclease/exonuclease/phosphatase [Lophiotrema nucula]
MVSKSMLSSLLKKQLTHVPQPQPFFTFLHGSWCPISAQRAEPHADLQHEYTFFRNLRLITWNIDFMTPYPQQRMAAALDHLESVVSRIPASTAVCIFLQEMCERDSDLTQICNSTWIRDKFHVTDIDGSKWNNHYGTVTMIDRRLQVANVARLPFVSEFHRDALLVDVPIGEPQNSNFLQLCNVHLDSMAGPMRPIQWKGAAAQLQAPFTGNVASILAGDCNANRPWDKTEPQDNGFHDAYLELGGVEDDEKGATWGFQSKDWRRWGRQRLDKVVFWGDAEVKSLNRLGIGIRVKDEEVAKKLAKQEELDFATDHYGLMAEFEIPGGLLTVQEQGDGDHAPDMQDAPPLPSTATS